MLRLGVDLGGTKIEAALVDDQGVCRVRHRLPTPSGYDAKLDAIAEAISSVEAEAGLTAPLPAGIGHPGSINPRTGLMRNANSTALNGHPLDRDLATRLNRPVRCANDANCFALSEARDGAGAGVRSVFGVIAGTPPATLLANYGLIGQTQPYHLTVDTRFFSPTRQAIEDVAAGKIDIALIWGPTAGYFAKRQKVALVVVPLLNEQTDARLDFRVSMAVRVNENDWKRHLNRILKRLKPKIDRILKDYGVPLLDRQRRLITD